ncbi:thymus-specific serine protease [Buteo buteo]|uniref:thymus-specific serine protease n=1 Tax=Buteo buteo TaxID=30397 RepID=UPI003EBB8157
MSQRLLLLLLLMWTEADPRREAPGGPGGVPLEGSLLQPLDHFDRLEGRSLSQRYWINREFWQQPDGPVFLLLGGESGLSPGVLSRGHVVELARAHGALLAALEHRFYGGSRGPGGDLDLRFLSSQQALADLAAFRLHVTSAWGLSPNHTWVCFGGSYAGALAAWARLKFPHLVSAAVASSAPIRAQVDFAGYHHVVSTALSSPTVGGSPECLGAVTAAFAALDGRLRGRQLAGVTRDFSCCRPPREPGDRELLAENVVDIFAGAVQYNGHRPRDSVAALCRAMTDGRRGSPYRRLVAINKTFLRRGGLSCTPSSRRAAVRELRHPKAGGNRRLWLFQTCTEFGFYPSCRDAACPFSRFQTLRAQLSLCADVFGISPARVRAAVAFTNAFYGAAHPDTRRVLFVNGELDPWRVLSAGGGRSGVLIAGASHCADMAPTRPGDPPALRAARQRIAAHLAAWLAPPAPLNHTGMGGPGGGDGTRVSFAPPHDP